MILLARHTRHRVLTLLVAGLATAAVAAVPADNRPGAHDGPTAAPRPPVSAPGVQVGQLRHRDVLFHTVTIDLRRARLDLVGQAPGPSAVRSFAALDGWLAATDRRLVMATNAGLFHVDHRPVGLHIEGGLTYAPIERATAGRGNFWLEPNGVFALDGGRARIDDTVDWPPPPFAERSPRLAVQSGPLLVHRGRIHPAFAPDSEHRRVRSAVAVRDPHTVVIALSAGPTRFHDLATALRDGLGCNDALYLDGGISGLLAPSVALSETAASQSFAGFFVVSRPTPPRRPAGAGGSSAIPAPGDHSAGISGP